MASKLKSFTDLNLALPLEWLAIGAVLDGEILCLDRKGNSQFKNLRGEHLFRLACKRNLEGIVAKWKFDPYRLDNAKS